MADTAEVLSLKSYIDATVETAVNNWQFDSIKAYVDEAINRELTANPGGSSAIDLSRFQSLKQYVDSKITALTSEWEFNAIKAYVDEQISAVIEAPSGGASELSNSARVQYLKSYIDQQITSELNKQEYQMLVSYTNQKILDELGGMTDPDGGTVAIATATVPGILRTNSTSLAPVVYLREEIDTMMSAKLEASALTDYVRSEDLTSALSALSGAFVKVSFSYIESFPKIIIPTFTGTIRTVSVLIETPFNGTTTTITVGDNSNSSSLVSSGFIDASTKAEYEFSPIAPYTSAAQIILSVSLGANVTQGRGIVIVGT